jgi:hypothetical protein
MRREKVKKLKNFAIVSSFSNQIRPYYTEYQYDIYDEKSKIIASITLADGQKIPLSAVLYSHSDNLFVSNSDCLLVLIKILFQAFINNFDVYVYNISKKISSRITSDGNRDTIHNGLVEWIYECKIKN